MRISFERNGGFSGMPLAATFDVDSLSPELGTELREALERVGFAALPERLLPEAPTPDQYEYRITVEADSWQHTVVTSDSSAPAGLQPLIQTLNRLARSQAGRK